MPDILLALIPGVSGILILMCGLMTAQGNLAMNAWVGIRVPSTTVNEETWQASHQAASEWIILSGIGSIVVAALILFIGDPHGLWTGLGMLWLGAFIIIATRVAIGAAKRVTVAGEAEPKAGRP